MQITLYTKDACSYCDRAKALLTNKALPYTVYKLGEDISIEEIRKQFPEARTFPIVVIDDVNVGGFTGLDKWIRENT